MNQSETLHQINEALAKAQGAFGAIEKRKTATIQMKDNKGQYSYRYADLADVLGAVTPALAENGICIRQPIRRTERGELLVVTELHHASGEFVGDDGLPLPSPGQAGPKDFSAGLTFMRRYGLCSLLGVAPDEDESRTQADGAAPRGQGSSAAKPPAQSSGPQGVISPAQATRFQNIAREAHRGEAEITDYLKRFCACERVEEIPKAKYDGACTWLRSEGRPETAQGREQRA